MKFFQSAAAAVALASAASAYSFDSVVGKPKLKSNKIQKDIKQENLWKHMESFNEIAFDNGGNRAFGLPGFAASVDYVWSHVGNATDAKAWKQDFPAWFAQVDSITLEIGGEDTYVYGLSYSPSTSEEGITAEVVHGPDGAAGCDPANYEDLDVEGKIVLVQRFRCPTGGTLAGRVLPAAQNGAKAVIIYSDIETKPTAGSLGEVALDKYVPAGFINLADGLALKERLDGGETIEVFFQQTQTVEERITQNVFVETAEGDPDNVIVLGAHLDSVQAGPGVNDDGSGSSLLLEVFKAVQKYSFKNKIRFAWWGAEENGLLGSEYYCENLEVPEINKILAYLNFDMVSKGYYGVSDNDGREYGSVAPKGSEVIQQIYLDHFESKGIETFPAILTNGSDYASFWGILNKPFGFLHTGVGVEQDECYHQACDTIDSPDPVQLTNNAQAAAHQISILATKGHTLIPKEPVNATVGVDGILRRSINLEEIQAMGDKQFGCGHDL